MRHAPAGQPIGWSFFSTVSIQRGRHWLQPAGSIAAVAALVLAAVATMQQHSAADGGDREASGSAAHAATAASEGASTFIGAYGGMPYTYPSDVVLQRPGVHDLTVKDVAWDGKPFKSPIYYGARISHWPEDAMFGGMLDFTHSKAISRFEDTVEFKGTLSGASAPPQARIGEVFRHLEFSHGHNMLTLNGLYRLPRLSARLLPYIGLGAGIAIPHTEIALRKDPDRTYEYQYAGPVGQALIGIEVRLPANISCFIEYKFTLAAYEVPLTHVDGWLAVTDLWRQMQRWLSGAAPVGGMVRTRLASHQLIAGLGVRIARPAAATITGP